MEHGSLILSGFGIVMSVLAMLWGVTALIATGFTRTPKPKEEAAKPATIPAVVSPAAPQAGPPERHLAVITAAVAANFATPHRIVSVSGPYAHVSAWTQQGLFEHFASHRMMWNSGPRTRPEFKF